MLRTIRLSLVAAATTALVACGGGGAKIGGGKEGAAKAAFSAGQSTGNANSGQSLLQQMANGAASGSVDFKVDCANSGSVKLTLDLSSDNQSGAVKYSAEYNDCDQDGLNSFNGKTTVEIGFSGSATALTVSIHLKGKLEISGEIDDYIDADVTESYSASFTDAHTGSVSIKVDGSIKTSTNSYTYANESITFSVDGGIPKDDSNS